MEREQEKLECGCIEWIDIDMLGDGGAKRELCRGSIKLCDACASEQALIEQDIAVQAEIARLLAAKERAAREALIAQAKANLGIK